LFEAAANYLYANTVGRGPCSWYEDRIPIRDTGTGFLYNGGGISSIDWQYGPTQRASVSYATGAHTIKAGFSAAETNKAFKTFTDRGQFPVQYQFNNGVPTQLTEFISPVESLNAVRMSLGVFVQDSWRVKRATVSAGLRYQYTNAYAPALDRPATALADAFTSTTRAWTDTNGNFYPDCSLRNPLANGECQAMTNQSFGGVQVRTRPDPDWIKGWGKAPYNWQASVSIDREVLSGVAVNAGYFRTWFGNQTVTDNLNVTPADFDPYCITAPTDSRLPGNISGQRLCGFYDLKPEKFGQIDNIVTLASKYGKWKESYNGVDFGINARLPRGARIGGGWNIGNSISLPPGMTFISSKQSRCFIVDSPQDLTYPLSIHSAAPGFANGCETANTYESRFKLNGSYPLPWNLQAAAVFQDLPGTYYSAFATYTTAQIAPSLGR